MPKISQGFSTIIVTLPSYKDSELMLKTNISVGDLAETEKHEGFDHSTSIIEKLLVKWNFEDEEGKELPITIENIKQLPIKDLTHLFEKINPYLQKKAPTAKTN
jgi:hypothetical protein